MTTPAQRAFAARLHLITMLQRLAQTAHHMAADLADDAPLLTEHVDRLKVRTENTAAAIDLVRRLSLSDVDKAQ